MSGDAAGADSASLPRKIIGWLGTAAAIIAATTVIIANIGRLKAELCNSLQLLCSFSVLDDKKLVSSIPSKFVHATGSFERTGNVWTEYPKHEYGSFTFITSATDEHYVYIVDPSRYRQDDPKRPFTLRLPIAGGMAQWSFPNPYIWQDLYPVSPES